MTLDYVEILGVCFSLLYILLEIKQLKTLWIIGFISSAFYTYIFFHAKFYADMGLNVYYMLASIYGWIMWSKNGEIKNSRQAQRIIRLKPTVAAILLVIFIIVFAALAFVLKRYTDSPVPYGDALTTALSIVATWMLAHKIIEQWWVWLFINIFSAVLYTWRGLYPTAFLFCCYAVASVIGYYSWKRKDRLWKTES